MEGSRRHTGGALNRDPSFSSAAQQPQRSRGRTTHAASTPRPPHSSASSPFTPTAASTFVMAYSSRSASSRGGGDSSCSSSAAAAAAAAQPQAPATEMKRQQQSNPPRPLQHTPLHQVQRSSQRQSAQERKPSTQHAQTRRDVTAQPAAAVASSSSSAAAFAAATSFPSPQSSSLHAPAKGSSGIKALASPIPTLLHPLSASAAAASASSCPAAAAQASSTSNALQQQQPPQQGMSKRFGRSAASASKAAARPQQPVPPMDATGMNAPLSARPFSAQPHAQQQPWRLPAAAVGATRFASSSSASAQHRSLPSFAASGGDTRAPAAPAAAAASSRQAAAPIEARSLQQRATPRKAAQRSQREAAVPMSSLQRSRQLKQSVSSGPSSEQGMSSASSAALISATAAAPQSVRASRKRSTDTPLSSAGAGEGGEKVHKVRRGTPEAAAETSRMATEVDTGSAASAPSSSATAAAVSSPRAASAVSFSLPLSAHAHASGFTGQLLWHYLQQRADEEDELAMLRAAVEYPQPVLLDFGGFHIVLHGQAEVEFTQAQQSHQRREAKRARNAQLLGRTRSSCSIGQDTLAAFLHLAGQMDVAISLDLSEDPIWMFEWIGEWLLEADDLLTALAAELSPEQIHGQGGRVVEACIHSFSFHLLSSLLHRSGLTLGDVSDPCCQSLLFDLALELRYHFVDYTPLLQLIRKHGLDGASRRDEEEVAVLAEEDDSGLTAAQLARRFVREHPLPPSTRLPPIALYNGALDLARAHAVQQFESTEEAEVQRCAQLHARFMHQLAATWSQHSQSVRALLLQAAPNQLIPDLVNICAEYLDLDPPEKRK